MVKAITIGYPDAKDRDTHDVLYSGNDRGAALAAAHAAVGYEQTEVCYPERIGKRVVFDSDTVAAAVAEAEAEAAEAEVSEDTSSARKPKRRR